MSRIFLEGEKVQVFHSVEVLGRPTGVPKGLNKLGNSRGEEGLTIILELGGHGRGRARWGVKMFLPPVLGYEYFLEYFVGLDTNIYPFTTGE